MDEARLHEFGGFDVAMVMMEDHALVEPAAGDRREDNLNPVSRLYYAGSTMISVPTSLDQPVGAALGAEAGFAKLASVIRGGGFGQVRKAHETPFNMILEARP